MGYLYYCPRCGNVYDDKGASYRNYKCECKNIIQTSLINSNIIREDIYDPNDSYIVDVFGKNITRAMYKTIWDTFFIQNSSRVYLNNQRSILDALKLNEIQRKKKREEALQKQKDGTLPILLYETQRSYNEGVEKAQRATGTIATPKCPKCGSQSIGVIKQGFGVGKAVAGVIAAGPEGALAGAVGANKVRNVCQNCGHQWEPGK